MNPLLKPGNTPRWMQRLPAPARWMVWAAIAAWIVLTTIIFFARYSYLFIREHF